MDYLSVSEAGQRELDRTADRLVDDPRVGSGHHEVELHLYGLWVGVRRLRYFNHHDDYQSSTVFEGYPLAGTGNISGRAIFLSADFCKSAICARFILR